MKIIEIFHDAYDTEALNFCPKPEGLYLVKVKDNPIPLIRQWAHDFWYEYQGPPDFNLTDPDWPHIEWVARIQLSDDLIDVCS